MIFNFSFPLWKRKKTKTWLLRTSPIIASRSREAVPLINQQTRTGFARAFGLMHVSTLTATTAAAIWFCISARFRISCTILGTYWACPTSSGKCCFIIVFFLGEFKCTFLPVLQSRRVPISKSWRWLMSWAGRCATKWSSPAKFCTRTSPGKYSYTLLSAVHRTNPSPRLVPYPRTHASARGWSEHLIGPR